MKNLMTKEDLNQIQFYKMPKTFFQNPKYMPLKNDAKLAYMLILDLLPLSIQNNWVNENNEVFVKLSRTKLMALLNIKSTRKAASVMKELVEHQLIIYKKVGLNKCNEIYIYPLEESTSKAKDNANPKQTKPTPKEAAAPSDIPSKVLDQVPSHIAVDDLDGDLDDDLDYDMLEKMLDDQLHIEDLKQRYANDLVDEVISNVCEMYLNKTTRIDKQDKPMSIIRSIIAKLKMYHIEHVIDLFREVSVTSNILYPKKYIQTLIYHSVFEANIKIESHIKHNFGW